MNGMNPKTSARAEGAPPSNRPDLSDAPRREVLVHVLLETFDLYVRSVAEITAETGLLGELTIETLMAYAIALPEADELIHGFIRGDLTLFPPAEQNRQLVDRDTRRLELEAPMPEFRPATRLGRKLAPRPPGAARPSSERSSDLHNFIKDNPEVFRQVRASSTSFLCGGSCSISWRRPRPASVSTASRMNSGSSFPAFVRELRIGWRGGLRWHANHHKHRS